VSRRVVFRRAARDDVREIHRWYRAQRPGLGAEFLRSPEVCIAQIERTPELYPVVDEETRRGRLRRFPYVVYYEVRDDEVLVLAVWHHRKNPRGWRDRG